MSFNHHNHMANLTLQGTVSHQSGSPIPRLTIEVSSIQFLKKTSLAQSRTGSKGEFNIRLQDVPDKAQLLVEVKDDTGKVVATQGPLPASGGDRTLRFTLQESRFKGTANFRARAELLSPFVQRWQADKRPISVADARVIADEAELPLGEAFRWMKAHELEEATKDGSTAMPAEAIYGLLKQGLPDNIAALSALPSGTIEAALKKAQEANQIDDTLQVGDLMRQWQEALGRKSLQEKPEGMDASLSELLSLAGLNSNHQKRLMEVFSTHEGTDEEFWAKASTVINNASRLAKARKAIQLTAFTGFQPKMVEALLAENTPTGLHAVAAVAGRDAQDWEAFLLQASSGGQSAVPTFIKGATETERQRAYAEHLAKTTEAAFPTHAFFGRVSKLGASNGGFEPVRADLQAFFAQNPGFEFRNAPIAALSEGVGLDLSGIAQPQNLLRELRSVRRMSAFAAGFNALQGLRAAGLDSARAVANLPRQEFVQRFATAFGSKEAAAKAHGRAEQKSSMMSLLWAAGHPNLNMETVATQGLGEPGSVARAAGDSPTLRSLFGSLDACDCEHCLSVYSPAAYLTDLLHFLESRSKPAYDELVRRRPDLPQLLLNCENTNTPLPYVDLVLELLEDFTTLQQISVGKQTELSGPELAANPEHHNASAYEVLKLAIYPRNLPFHLPLEETRVYLGHLKQPRHELMAIFHPNGEAAAFEDRHRAMEFLGISPQERDILTGQTTGNGSADSGTWNFYGFDKPTGFRPITDPSGQGALSTTGDWLATLAGRVDVFLQQAELSYVELLELLECRFVNPHIGGSRKITIVAAAGALSSTCQLDKLQVSNLEESDLVRLHRFVRLSRRLGWHFYDLDKALSGIIKEHVNDPLPDYLVQENLNKLSQVEQLRRRFQCSVEEVLALWYDIPSTLYIDFSKEKSLSQPTLYGRLFQNKAVLNPLPGALNRTPDQLTGSLESQLPAILAALQLQEADYRLIANGLPNGNLNLSNLSHLYRHVLLARWMGMDNPEMLRLTEITSTKPFYDPPSMYAFLAKAEFVEASGFSVKELDYLLLDRFTEPSGIAPTTAAIHDFLAGIKALPEKGEATVLQQFSSGLGLSARAADLLLKGHLKSTDGTGNPLLQGFLDTNAVEEHLLRGYRKAAKAAFFIQKLKIQDAELEKILAHRAETGCLDFDGLPTTEQVSTDFEGFETLVNLIRARDLMGFGTGALFEVLGNALGGGSNKKAWLEALNRVSQWNEQATTDLIGDATELDSAGLLKASFPADFRNGDLILRLKKALDALNLTGLNAETMKRVILPETNETIAAKVKQAAKSKHSEAQWLKIAKPLRDELRERQRAALLSHALHKSTEWRSVEELYEYLLIDVERKPVVMTSRLKQAICSVQLFVDRVLMHLEIDPAGIPIRLEPEQAEEWKTWRKVYRVWEANRKVFLYPENWIEPELRDDQTPFFREAVSALMQNELTPETVEDAFRGYLEKLDEVARLEIVGITRQLEDKTEDSPAVDILHVFGRTYTQPHRYFHRTFEKGEWTPWLKIEADIDSDHLVPVVFNRRLCLFWLFFTQEAAEGEPINPSSTLPLEKTKLYWKIQVAWSEFRKGAWTAKKLSKSYVQTDQTDSKPHLTSLRNGLFVRHYQQRGLLFLHLTPVTKGGKKSFFNIPVEGGVCEASFVFEDTASEPKVILDVLPPENSLLAPSGVDFKAQLLQERLAAETLTLGYETLMPTGRIISTAHQMVLGKTPQPGFSLAVQAGAVQPLQEAFVFQDSKNSFWVKTSRNPNPPADTPPSPPVFPTRPLLTDLPDMFAMERIVEETWGQTVRPQAIALKRRDDDGIPDIPDFEPPGGDPEPPVPPTPPTVSVKPKCLSRNPFAAPTSDTMTLRMAHSYAPAPNAATRVLFNYRFTSFYHPHVKNFVRKLNQSGVPGVLRRKVQEADDLIVFQQYQPTTSVIGEHPKGIVDFAYGGPYSQYNWELFFHLPIHIACRLSADQRFEEARRWFHYIFDPTSGEEGGKERFWQFNPFHETAQAPLTTLEDLLLHQSELERQVEKWAANPFQPHVVARMRITAYMKFTVMKYVDNLVAWGDQLFRRDTIESINEATNLYVLAAKILSNKPQRIPAQERGADQNYSQLSPHLDAFSNVQMEDLLPATETGDEAGGGSIASALGSMFYFCVPRNEYLLRYWDTVADRLFKIRHSLNIEGIFRSLPLFEPPIDPALLVRATAAGLDLNSLLDSNATTGRSYYRFAYMLQKANEVVNEVKGLGAALLSALEKRDAEALALLRSGHEQHLLAAILQVRERQVEEAKEGLEGVKKSLEAAKGRFAYYSSRKNMSRLESEAFKNTDNAQALTFLQGEYNTVASVLAGIPELKIGSPTTTGTEFGGMHISAIYSGISAAAGTAAGVFSSKASQNATLASYERRMDDWKFQATQAQTEIEQLERQLLASEIRLEIAKKEQSNHRLQMEQSAEADEFMRSKFSNRQLFDWMVGQLSALYFQTYRMAYDLGKQAEQCFQFELPHDAPAAGYVKFGYWDNLKKGLLAGEQLQFDLRRLELAHLEQNKREFEITKHISLRQVNPLALLDLRENGTCIFSLPEALFDMDFPGHYRRRIKSMAISIPCITGPYTGLNATLRLQKDEYRRLPDLSTALEQNHAPSTAIAVSNGQGDSGVFELNFRDERYLPFEGAGVISEWKLELPEFRQFDYQTISDVVMHLRYTALEDGAIKAGAVTKVNEFIASNSGITFAVVDLLHDLPAEWHKAMQQTNDDGQHVLNIPDLRRFLPFYAHTANAQVTGYEFRCSPSMIIAAPSTITRLDNIEVKFNVSGEVQWAFVVVKLKIG